MTGLGASKLPKLPPKQHEHDLPHRPPKLPPKQDEQDLPLRPPKLPPKQDEQDLPLRPSKLPPKQDEQDLPLRPPKCLPNANRGMNESLTRPPKNLPLPKPPKLLQTDYEDTEIIENDVPVKFPRPPPPPTQFLRNGGRRATEPGPHPPPRPPKLPLPKHFSNEIRGLTEQDPPPIPSKDTLESHPWYYGGLDRKATELLLEQYKIVSVLA